MALLCHAIELEDKFGIGPHTISFPRLEPAGNTPFVENPGHRVDDGAFKKLVTVLRLAVPYTGMILTARENAQLRREVLPLGCTQTDASTKIDIGGYAERLDQNQPDERQQFILGDTRSLDEFVYDLCREGYLPSFCTAGYREGRTGANFMPLAKHATVNRFCIANGILTFKEYLLDYASPRTKAVGAQVIDTYLTWIDTNVPHLAKEVRHNLEHEEQNQRDLHF